MGIALFYFTEATCEQGGSAAPRAMLNDAQPLAAWN